MTDGANTTHSVILQEGEPSYGSDTSIPYVQVGGEHFKEKMILSQQQQNCHNSYINQQVVKLVQEPPRAKSLHFQAFVRTLFSNTQKNGSTEPREAPFSLICKDEKSLTFKLLPDWR